MAEMLNVLIIEDSEDDSLLIMRELKRGGYALSSERVETRESMLAALKKNDWDVIISDYNLPHFSAPEALELLQESNIDIPFIVVSGKVGEEIAIEIVQAGADDYVLKDNLIRLVPAIERELRESETRRERKRIGQQRELYLSVLECLNSDREQSNLIGDLLKLIKEFSGCQAVGIRLQSGDDFPYYEANGFVDGHVELENSLCAYDQAGELIRDSKGDPVLECMCGNIICSRFDPEKPFFTEGGSFWTNSTTDLLASTTEKDRQTRTRNRCNGEGYESVALIPLRTNQGNMGLLQINDFQRDRFTPDLIRFYEGIAQSIGIVLMKRQTEELLKELFDNLAVGIYINQGGKFQLINPRFQQISGCSERELKGMNTIDFVHPEDKDTVRESAVEMLKGRQSAAYEYRFITKSGETRWGTESVAPIIFNGRKATLGSFMDITESKKRDEQLLLSSRLASVGELAAGVAHEINNPLTGVIGYAQLLAERDDVPADIKGDLSRIHQESQRAVRIVQNLLRFSRRHKPAKTYQDINDLVQKTLELRSYELRTENTTVNLNLAANIPYVLADHNQIQQVILNLVVNAQQAISEVRRKGKIAMETKSVNGQVILSISDNGSGVAKDDLNNIFSPFFTTKPVGKGSGLGLSVCHGIITEHGGHIYVESEKGKGATFIVELPAVIENQVLANDVDITIKDKETSDTKAEGSILVIDDEAAIRDILVRTLADEGHRVSIADSGNAALSRMAKVIDDVYIVDIKMPGMGGVQFYEEVEKLYPDLTPRIIFITRDSISPTTQRFFASTGRPYLIKPFAYLDLVKLVNKTLKGL